MPINSLPRLDLSELCLTKSRLGSTFEHVFVVVDSRSLADLQLVASVCFWPDKISFIGYQCHAELGQRCAFVTQTLNKRLIRSTFSDIFSRAFRLDINRPQRAPAYFRVYVDKRYCTARRSKQYFVIADISGARLGET